ncbi:MAG TPA: chorismate mutase [Bacillota bacterium]|jgi:chorismate mutase|nr:chorismate mutase [Bacillota bacterium]HOL09321.1 chorismate mutase [Bacillota bacterium]HPO97648.1 chorismate mutase [Bacillota bacterium]
MEKLWAVRGGITIDEDTPEAILAATKELLEAIIKENNIDLDSIVSIIFTTTPDIKSEFPAVAARQLGLIATPLICAQEIAKPGALPKCIRVLIHFYTDLKKEGIRPVYLREAVRLRPDLFEDDM